MANLITKEYYKEIKTAVNRHAVITQWVAVMMRECFDVSETTLRRIKKSKNYADYQRICRQTSGKYSREKRGKDGGKKSCEFASEKLPEIFSGKIGAVEIHHVEYLPAKKRRKPTRFTSGFLAGLLYGTIIFAIGFVVTYLILEAIS